MFSVAEFRVASLGLGENHGGKCFVFDENQPSIAWSFCFGCFVGWMFTRLSSPGGFDGPLVRSRSGGPAFVGAPVLERRLWGLRKGNGVLVGLVGWFHFSLPIWNWIMWCCLTQIFGLKVPTCPNYQ